MVFFSYGYIHFYPNSTLTVNMHEFVIEWYFTIPNTGMFNHGLHTGNCMYNHGENSLYICTLATSFHCLQSYGVFLMVICTFICIAEVMWLCTNVSSNGIYHGFTYWKIVCITMVKFLALLHVKNKFLLFTIIWCFF